MTPNKSTQQPSASTLNGSLQNALVPFRLAEQWNQPVGYERSIKLSAHGLLSNRYLIGVPVSVLSIEQFKAAIESLQMPRDWHAAFLRRLPRAKMFFMGYEESSSYDCLKAYLEFRPGEFASKLSHIGWKWSTPSGLPQSRRLTWYYRVDAQTPDTILQQLHLHCSTIDSPPMTFATKLLSRIDSNILFTSVRERSGRHSFDLNVYSANLRVGAIENELRSAATEFGISSSAITRQMGLCGDCVLGHVAGGTIDGKTNFLTIYYSPDPIG